LSTSVVLPWSTWAMIARLRKARGMVLIHLQKKCAHCTRVKPGPGMFVAAHEPHALNLAPAS
jgi:hypothetical protein